MILLVSAFTRQKCHLQNREPVSFSLIHSKNDVSCLEKSDVLTSFFNLNKFGSSEEEIFWKLTKNPYKLVIAAR